MAATNPRDGARMGLSRVCVFGEGGEGCGGGGTWCQPCLDGSQNVTLSGKSSLIPRENMTGFHIKSHILMWKDIS